MKKFFAMLMMATLVFSLAAVAAYGPTYDLSNGNTGEIPVLEPVQFNTNNTVYKPSNLMLNYTVTDSVNRRLLDLVKVKDENGNFVYASDPETGKYKTKWYGKDGQTSFDLAHVYFTANDNYRMALFVDVDSNPTSELRIDSQLNITDYGIYLYENNDPSTNNITEYISLKNGDYAITEGTNFGVYYEADTHYYVKDEQFNPNNADLSKTTLAQTGVVREDSKGVRYTTAENWIASYDGEKPGNHNVASNMNWYSDGKILKSDAAIFCMYQGPFNANDPAFLEWQHVEFGFVTTGQPLPGTLTTLLISGLCAAGLRKKSKK